ncbi:MAG: aldehyde dehydrogenase (NADP(+)) [Opitutaceae bacterium]
MELHGQNFVADQLSIGTGRTFAPVSPLDSQPIGDVAFYPAADADVEAAMKAADAAFESFRETTGEQRASFLEKIADEIVALGDALITRANQETGLTVARLVSERGRTVGQLKFFAQVARENSWVDARIDTAMPERQPQPRSDLRRLLIPVGPVVVFGASNFPLAFSVGGGDTASAFVTGNPVIVKAHERHPGTSELVAGAIRRAVIACGLPGGVFSMLQGLGKDVGIALVKHPLARAVTFTGSRTAGRALFDAAAARHEPIPVFAEMSSVNPVFILPEAMRERSAAIAEALQNSITVGVGQFCTKPGLVFGLQSGGFDEFQQSFATFLEASPAGTMLHGGIWESFNKGTAKAGKIEGVQTVARAKDGGNPAKTQAGAIALRTDVENFRRQPDLAEEVFGPLALLISAKTFSELEEAARGLEGQLTATIHGTPEDLRQAAPLLRILERKAGRLLINGFPTGVEVSHAMNHGGPYPATTDVRFTSVGSAALLRFVRPVCYQDFPSAQLPAALRGENPLGLWRLVNGKLANTAVS